MASTKKTVESQGDPINPKTGLTRAQEVEIWNESRVLVATNDFYGFTHTPHKESFAQFMYESSDLIKAGRMFVYHEHFYMTDYARSKMAQVACRAENAFTHLFMFDSDMTVELSDITRLLSHRVDVVSGTYFMRAISTRTDQPRREFPCVATRNGVHITREEIAEHAAKNQLISCTAVGGGSLLVTVDALRKIGQPAFEFDWRIFADSSTYVHGEDTVFSRLCINAGFPVLMDPLVRPEHFAMVRVGYDVCDKNGTAFYTPPE